MFLVQSNKEDPVDAVSFCPLSTVVQYGMKVMCMAHVPCTSYFWCTPNF